MADKIPPNKLFASMTAWFSPSCSAEAQKKWEKEGGKIVDNVSDAMFLFSDNPECNKTMSVYKNEPTVVIFQTKWIEQAILCSINGVLSTHKIETYILVPTCLKKETRISRTKPEYKRFVEQQEAERKTNWEKYEQIVSAKTGKRNTDRTNKKSLPVPKLDDIEETNESNGNEPINKDNDKKKKEASNNKTKSTKKICKTKTKRRSNMNLSESSSEEDQNANNKISKQKATTRKSSSRSHKKPLLESTSESSEADDPSYVPVKVDRTHRSANNYKKKYVEPDTDSSDFEMKEPEDQPLKNKTKAKASSKDNEVPVRNKRSSSKSQKESKGNESEKIDVSNKQNNIENDNANESSCIDSVSSSSKKQVTDKSSKTEQSNKKSNTLQSSTRSNTNNENKEKTNAEIPLNEGRSYPKRNRKPVSREGFIADVDLTNIENEFDQDEPGKDTACSTRGSNKKRKLYNPTVNSMKLKEPVICIEKTPITRHGKPDLDREKLSPNDIHKMLNDVDKPQVLLSDNVRSSERKKAFTNNSLAASPQLAPAAEIPTNSTPSTAASKSKAMKEHMDMINHKKIGEKSLQDFTYGSFSGYTHIDEFDDPAVRLEDFIVTKNGCRVRLLGKLTSDKGEKK